MYVRSFRCFFGIKFIYFIVKVSAINLWLWNFFIFYQVNNFFCSSLSKKNGLTDSQNFLFSITRLILSSVKYSFLDFLFFFCVSSPWNVTIFHEGFISQFWRYVIRLTKIWCHKTALICSDILFVTGACLFKISKHLKSFCTLCCIIMFPSLNIKFSPKYLIKKFL